MMFLATLFLLLQGIVIPPQDPQGWTIINKSPDTREIYVSSSAGNDVNPGTIAQPLASFQAAIEMTRDNSADHIYLKSGDEWSGNFTFTKRGRSFSEPIVITSYGDGPRPLIKGVADGAVFANPWGSSGGLKNLWIIDLSFRGKGQGDLVTFMWDSENVLLEGSEIAGDPMISGFCLVFDGLNMVVRRNILHNTKQGIYSGWLTDFVLLEQNYFFNFWDNNYGNWIHATYFDNENMGNGHQPTVLFKENVVGNVEHTGLQARCSADIINNTVFRTGVGISLGGSNDYPVGCSPATGDVIDNVILHGTTYSTPWALSWGFALAFCDGVNFTGNIIANNDIAGGMDIASPRAISLDGRISGKPNAPDGVKNLYMAHNIVYNWGEDTKDYSAGMMFNCDPDTSYNINIEYLDIQEPFANEWTWISYDPGMMFPNIKTSYNRFLGQPTLYGLGGAPASFAAWKAANNDIGSVEQAVKYRYPQLTIPLYNKLVCGGQETFDDFIARCEQQRKGNWKSEYTSAKINQTFRRAFSSN